MGEERLRLNAADAHDVNLPSILLGHIRSTVEAPRPPRDTPVSSSPMASNLSKLADQHIHGPRLLRAGAVSHDLCAASRCSHTLQDLFVSLQACPPRAAAHVGAAASGLTGQQVLASSRAGAAARWLSYSP